MTKVIETPVKTNDKTIDNEQRDPDVSPNKFGQVQLKRIYCINQVEGPYKTKWKKAAFRLPKKFRI